MVTERERAAFLGSSPALERLPTPARWELARIGTESDLPGRSVIDPATLDQVLVVRDGELLVVRPDPLPGQWVDDDGLARDAAGARIMVDPVTGGRVVGRLYPGDIVGCPVLQQHDLTGCVLRAGTLGTQVTAVESVAFHLVLASVLLACPELDELEPGAEVDVHRMGLYNDLPMRDLACVMQDARLSSFRPGDTVVAQGECGDRFFVVLDGYAIVERDGAIVARLERGSHFGELALLRDAHRAATVRATAPMRTWSISRDSFDRILRHRLAPRADVATRDLAQGIGPGGAWGSPLAARLRRP